MSLFQPFASKLFSNHKVVSPQALDITKQRERLDQLDDPITQIEFITATNNLKNNKSPGMNGIPCDTFKAMDTKNKQNVFNLIKDYWNGNSDYDEWHTGKGIPVPQNETQKIPTNIAQ